MEDSPIDTRLEVDLTDRVPPLARGANREVLQLCLERHQLFDRGERRCNGPVALAGGLGGVRISETETNRSGRRCPPAHDLQVLEATAGKTWFDIFHLHGQEISFDQVLDYPVHAFNYHDRDYGPSLSEMRKRTDKCLLGGISPGGAIATGTPDEVAWEVEDAWRQLGGRGLIITPGEVANPRSKPANVDRLRTAIEATRSG